MTNERNDSLVAAQFRAVQATASHREHDEEPDAVTQVLTGLMRHGGLYSLMDTEMMTARMGPLMMMMKSKSPTAPHMVSPDELTPKDISSFVASVSSTAASFFQHLVKLPHRKDLSYPIPSSLMSHIAFPCSGTCAPGSSTMPAGPAAGVVYKDPSGGLPSPEIPAAFTFVGQFVDHDLTMNAVNLFDDQSGVVQNTASPLIDLDSVYGPRTKLTVPAKKIFNADGSFKLKTLPGAGGTTYVDLTRKAAGTGNISDMRNDENQMVLQIHLLVMRLHNKFIAMGMSLEEAYTETLFNWQSVLLNDYLTRILDPAVYTGLLGDISAPDFGGFKYKPCKNLSDGSLSASLPHEFAIGFRFGHSQLRSKYQLTPGGTAIPLFDNRLAGAGGVFADMRGGQQLAPDHVIDFDFFAGSTGFKGNAIDSHVTPVVADLPESAIPDDIKFIGNLAHRNLIRSRQVGLCAGEDLAKFYGVTVLSPNDIEPDASAHGLYMEHGKFRTPLWFYLLKEAEKAGTATSSRLGEVGSHVVGEVILGAIKWARESVMNQTGGWTSKITPALPNSTLPNLGGTSAVTLLDIAHFVA